MKRLKDIGKILMTATLLLATGGCGLYTDYKRPQTGYDLAEVSVSDSVLPPL